MPGIRLVAVSTAITTGLLTIAGSAVLPAGPQTATTTAEQITAYYAEHTNALQLSIVFWSFAAASLLAFSGVTAALLRRNGAAAELATVFAGAGCVAAALMLAAQGPMAVGAREDFTAADDATRRTIYILADVTYSLGDLVLPVAGLLVGALSLAALRRILLPRWLGYLGTPLAAAAMFGAIAPLHGEHVGVFEILEVAAYLLWPLWMIAMGITLAVRRDRPVRPETAVAAA